MAANGMVPTGMAPAVEAAQHGLVVTLLPAVYGARLMAALPSGVRIHRVASWTQLWSAAAMLPDAVVVDPLMCDATVDQHGAASPIASVAPVIVYTSVSAVAMHRLLSIPALARARLVLAGVDDGRTALRDTFLEVRTAAHCRRALDELRACTHSLPPDVADAIAALFSAGGPFSVVALARAAQLSTRTLQRRLTDAHGPSPIWLIRMARALLARELLSSSLLTIDEVARRVGYAKPQSLRALLRWSFHSSPSMLRTP